MTQRVNTAALTQYMKERDMTLPQLARLLEVDYSYLYRVMNGEKPGGSKVVIGVLRLCAREGLDINRFVFLPEPLSGDNGIQTSDRESA